MTSPPPPPLPPLPPSAWPFAIDSSASGTNAMSNPFLGAALLSLAARSGSAADSALEDVGDPTITFLLVQMKASSLLAFMSAISGVLCAMFMPLFGAVVDHTAHRKTIAVLSALALVLINAFQAGISAEADWRKIATLQIMAGWFFLVHFTSKASYLPEMEDEAAPLSGSSSSSAAAPSSPSRTSSTVSRVSSLSTGVSFFAQFLFLAFCIAFSALFAPPPLASDSSAFQAAKADAFTASISQLTTAALSSVLYAYAWWRLPSRPPLHSLPPNSRLLTAGFSKLSSTLRALRSDRPALAAFLVVTALSEAGANAFATIAVTYTKVVIEMTADEAGILFAVVLLMGESGCCFVAHVLG